MINKISPSSSKSSQSAKGIVGRIAPHLRTTISQWFGRANSSLPASALIFLSLTAFALLRSYPNLTPQPSSINAHDQAEYIHSGVDLLQGKIPPLAYHPLVSIVYAAGYLPFRNSPIGFILTEWFVRMVLYSGLWASVWLVAHEFRRFVPPWTLAAIWAVAPLPDRLLSNSSQMLFVILSALALWQMMRFASRQRTRNLLAASLALGFAMLARNEALWILLLSAPAVLIVDRLPPRETTPPQGAGHLSTGIPRLVAFTVPFVFTILIFQATYFCTTGLFDTGLSIRTYDALEAGQGLTYPERYPGNPFISGISDSRRIYGSGQDNGQSVLRAVLRNPSAMIQRIGRNILGIPTSLVQGYGGYLGAMLIVFAICGLVTLARLGQWKLLSILVAFSFFELLYLPFFWLTSYWLFLFPIVFALVAVGIKWVIYDSGPLFWAAALALAAALLVTSALIPSWRWGYIALASLTFIAVSLLSPRSSTRDLVRGVAVAALALLIANPTYVHSPELFPDVASDPATQAASWIRTHAPAQAKVAAWGATTAYLSNRPFLSLEGYLSTPARMADWLVANQVSYVYADSNLAATFPGVLPVVDALAAKGCLMPVFKDGDSVGILYAIVANCSIQ